MQPADGQGLLEQPGRLPVEFTTGQRHAQRTIGIAQVLHLQRPKQAPADARVAELARQHALSQRQQAVQAGFSRQQKAAAGQQH